MDFGGMGGFGGTGMVWMTLGLVAILVFALWALRDLISPPGPRTTETALEVLSRRYARGEISAAEFEQAKRTLGAV